MNTEVSRNVQGAQLMPTQITSPYAASESKGDHGWGGAGNCPGTPDLGPCALATGRRPIDAEVWEGFSEDLLLLFMKRLPWWKNLELRCVCRSWNSTLSNLSFLARSSPAPSLRAPFIIYKECTLLNFEKRKYRGFPWSSPKLSRGPSPNNIMAASAGLFLIERLHGLQLDVIFLVNPLNRTREQVEVSAIGPYSQLLTMEVNQETHNVRILYLHNRFQQNLAVGMVQMSMYMYDMFRKSWELISRTLQPLSVTVKGNAVLMGNDVYVLMVESSLYSVMKVMPTQLVELPTRFGLNHSPTGFRDGVLEVCLFQHRGCLMLTRNWRFESPTRKGSLDIWRLDSASQRWEKVWSMPENLMVKFKMVDHVYDLTVDAEGDFVCLVSNKIIIVYNLVEDFSWEIKHQGYHHRFRTSCEIGNTFLWQPGLDIVLSEPISSSDRLLETSGHESTVLDSLSAPLLQPHSRRYFRRFPRGRV